MSARIPVNYPGKKSLRETEAVGALKRGPELHWFHPWAKRGVNMSDAHPQGYGYFHIYSANGAFNYDFAAWPTEEGLRYGLETLWQHHTGEGIPDDPTYPRCERCESVMYFVPDAAAEPRLYGVVEHDGEDGEGES